MELPGIPTLSERREVVRPGAGLPLRPKNRISEVTMGHWQNAERMPANPRSRKGSLNRRERWGNYALERR